MPNGHDPDGQDPWGRLRIGLLVCGVTLIVGYAAKACPAAIEETRLGFACHTDITALFASRGIDVGRFPYVGGRLAGDVVAGRLSGYDLELVGGANEYPVLTGLFMWAVGLLARDAGQYLILSAAFLAMAALATAALLAWMAGGRGLIWSASPILVLFAFHNWDLLAVGVTTLGLAARWRGRPTLAAVCFGLGGALKLYPLLLLAPLVMERWHRGDRQGARAAAAAGSVAVALPNLPIALLDIDGWMVTYRFHSLRPPNYDSLWGVGPLYDLGPAAINVVSTALLVGTAIVVVLAARRAATPSSYPFVAVSAALIATSLLWGKVHSPQYALWILPFFALLRVRPVWWIAYTVDIVVLYVGVFVLGSFSLRALQVVVPAAVYLRAALLAALIIVFLRAADATTSTASVEARSGRDGDASVPAGPVEPST